MRTLLVGIALLLIQLVPSPARAQLARPGPGNIILTGEFQLSLQIIDESGSDSSLTLFAFEPAFDYVTSSNVTIGGHASFIHTKIGDESADGYGLGGRVGVLIPFGPQAVLWPRIGLAFAHNEFSSTLLGISVNA